MPRKTIARPLPPVEYLHECFHYSPETGVLTWRDRPRSHFASERAHLNFLSKWAGKGAGKMSELGYLHVGLAGNRYLAHRIAWVMYYGEHPAGGLDHINLVKDDNRITNLRDVDQATNSRGHVRSRANTSGFTGVSWHSRDGKWWAQIRVQGKGYDLGKYLDKGDAIAARKAANLRFGFSENHGKPSQCKVSSAGLGRLPKDNKSGYLGVHLNKRTGRWAANLYVDGRQRFLGYYDTREEAAAARRSAEIAHGVVGRPIYGSGAIIQDPPT